MPKIQPAVKTLSFVLTNASGEGSAHRNFVDLSQCASIVNRRFYRQGLNWVVAGFKLISHDAWAGEFYISKLPDNWVTSNSWHKAYAQWKKQQDEAVDDAGAQSAVAKFRDFKVHMNVDHVTAGFPANSIPVNRNLSEFLTGEWQASQIVLPQSTADASGTVIDPTELFLHMVGVNQNAGVSRGIIEGYADSRAYPQSPDPVSPDIASADNWMAQMHDVGSDDSEILLRATHVNDDLPYNQINYPGGETNSPYLQVVDRVSINSNAVFANVSAKGDTFPCGLINVDTYANAGSPSSAISMQVYLVPGEHRGYLCQPMQDM